MSQTELKRARLQALARVLSGRGKLTVMFGDVPSTDLKNIILKLIDGEIVPGVPATKAESWVAMRAAAAHESAHIRFTSKKIWEQAIRHSRLMAHLVNIIEDARIERCISNLYPGTLLWFRFVNDYIFLNNKDWGTGPKALMSGLICYAVVGRLPVVIEEQEDVAELVYRCAPHVDRGRFAPDTETVYVCAQEIFNIIREFLESFSPPPVPDTMGTPNPEKAPDGKLDPRRKPSLPKPKKHGEEGVSGKERPDKKLETSEKSYESHESELNDDKSGEPNAERELEGDKTLKSGSSAKSDNRDDEPEPDEGDAEPTHGDEDEPGEDNEKPEAEISGPDSKETKPESEPQVENEPGDEINDEPDGEHDSGNESEDEEPKLDLDEDPSDDPEGESDTGLDEGPDKGPDDLDDDPEDDLDSYSKSDPDDAPDAGDDEGSGEKSDPDWPSESDSDMPADHDVEDGIDMGDYAELIEEADTELSTIESSTSRDEKAKARTIIPEIDKHEITAELSKGIHRGCSFVLKKDFRVTDGIKALYEAIHANVKPYINKTVNEIRRVLEYKTTLTERNLRKGKIHGNSLWKLHVKDPKVFCKVSEPNDIPELSVYLLVDCSGSMNTFNRMKGARSAACLLYETCIALKIPVNITGFTGEVSSDRDVTHFRVISYEDGYDKKYNIAYLRAQKQNRDGYSIRVATGELQLRNEQQKILIVLSDGMPEMPYKRYGGAIGINDTALAVREAEKQGGIGVVGLYFGPAEYLPQAQKIYNNCIYVSDISVLPLVIGRVLKKVITSL